VTSIKPELKVFYIDYGNEEVLTPDQLKGMPSSVMDIPALVRLFCYAAYFVMV
jgi:hypothetical protein